MKKYVIIARLFMSTNGVCRGIEDERVFDTLEGAIDYATKITYLSNPIIYEAKCALQTIREDKVVWDSVELKREIPIIEILRTMKENAVKKTITKQELVEMIKANFSDEDGNIICDGLDFGKGVSVRFKQMKIDGNLNISGARVTGDVFQGYHTVQGTVCQEQHKVAGDVQQRFHTINGELQQGYQCVSGAIFQYGSITQNRIYQNDQLEKNIKTISNPTPEKSNINHPEHYNTSKIECIDYIEDIGFGEGFNLGNAIKYIVRAKHKNNHIDDLQKAKWYIERELERLNKGEI